MRQWKTWFALGMLAVSAVISHKFLFKQVIQGNSDFTRHISKDLGSWRVLQEMPISQSEIIGLETRDVVRSIYTDGKSTIELVVAYIAHSSRKSAHAQEACLRGAGALVGSIETVQFTEPVVSGKLISLQYLNNMNKVLYFYKIGDRYTADYLKSSWLMFFGGLTGQEQKGTALVRLLTPEKRGENPDAVTARLKEFCALLIPELESKLP